MAGNFDVITAHDGEGFSLEGVAFVDKVVIGILRGEFFVWDINEPAGIDGIRGGNFAVAMLPVDDVVMGGSFAPGDSNVARNDAIVKIGTVIVSDADDEAVDFVSGDLFGASAPVWAAKFNDFRRDNFLFWLG